MPIRRVFIPWTQPALEAAATFLVERRRQGSQLDLSRTLAALPGGRAKRRLLELLVERCEAERLNLTPPQLVTVGALPERLYEAKYPFASTLAQDLAWVRALQRFSARQLAPLLPHRPEEADFDRWLSLGQMLRQLHTELASSRLDFADVAAGELPPDEVDERERWRVLAAVQVEYLAILDRLGLWDLQTARLYAIEHREPRWDGEIVLVGTVDLDPAQRAMIDLVADRVTTIVFAPQELSDRFDEHGCLRPDAWQAATIDVRLEQMTSVDRPAQQADAVAAALASLQGRYAAESITIGVPDESLAPHIERRLAESGVTARYGVGTPLAQTAPYRLLEAAAEYLKSHRFEALAALARHPAVDEWLRTRGTSGDCLTALDRYQERRLPATIDHHAPGHDDDAIAVRRLCQQIGELLLPLASRSGSLADGAKAVVEQLAQAYGGRERSAEIEPDRTLVRACQALADQAQELSQLAEDLAPTLSGVEAAELVLEQAARVRIPPPSDPDAVEMVGWLELLLDDAPALVIAGFNEGVVPAAHNADLFLPDPMRRALQLEDNQRRYARDAYALSAIAASREFLQIVVGRRSGANDPLLPSRLLLACGDDELAERVRQLFGGHAATPAPRERPAEPRGRAVYRTPRPAPLAEPVTSMRVTEFRDYLACPYRYYLRHRLGLTVCSDDHQELDGGAFGSLLHDVLSAFGSGPQKDLDDAEPIRAALEQELDRLVRRKFGASALAAVAVQIEQMKARLAAFARRQAEWRRQGYRILYVERSFEGDAARVVVDGQPMAITGRIDRIDEHESGESYAVLDYKSGDTPLTPDKAHRDAQGGWIDLQLPLYRQLVRSLKLSGAIQLGYILLPKDADKVGFQWTDWTTDVLNEADQVIDRVIRAVRKQLFWPPAEQAAGGAAEFAAICQEDVYGPGPTDDEGAAEDDE